MVAVLQNGIQILTVDKVYKKVFFPHYSRSNLLTLILGMFDDTSPVLQLVMMMIIFIVEQKQEIFLRLMLIRQSTRELVQ